MMLEKLDLGLSLSFNASEKNLNIPSSLPFHMHQNKQLGNMFPIPAAERSEQVQRPFLNAIDVNRVVKAAEDEDEGASSPPSTLSCVSGGKRSERDAFFDAPIRPLERTSSRGTSDEEDGDVSRKKLRLSKEQSAVLEEFFKDHNTLNPKQKLALSKELKLRPRQVEVWFQNRRARTKLKQTEVDCEYLKRWCEKLNEENRKLQKELNEVKALKMLSPYQFSQLNNVPPTTISMCPSCQRVSPSNTASVSSLSANQHQHNFFPVVANAVRNQWPMSSVDAAYNP